MRINTVNSFNIYNKNQFQKTQIQFGEAKDYDSRYSHISSCKRAAVEAKWLARKEQIETYYNKQLDDLAKLADEVGMDYNYYWNQANKIRAEKQQMLRQAKSFFRI